jgi:predicted ATP-binding protein involved in virulence
MTALRLDQLSLTNFRCFGRCEVDLHPELTALVAENGSGKTAVLDAAAAALSVFVNALYPHERVRGIDRTDVRLVSGQEHKMVPCLPTEYEARGIVLDAPVTWGSTVKTYLDKVRPSKVKFKPLQVAAQDFRSDKAILPLVAYYGTGRLWCERRLTENRRSSITNVEERVTGYADCLTSASSFKGISTWFESRDRQIASPAYKESLQANLAMVEGVKTAAGKVLKPTGWSNLHWDSGSHSLIVEHEKQGSLPLSMLSDGVRTMLALVADVARRCASLNPNLKDQASVQTPGVLLIDEVDMHLHPRCQQQVLGLLRDAFPALQIIVTTHSPHVLSTVDKSSIRVLHIKNGEVVVETPLMQTRGVESSSVLASVMDVDPIPQLDETRDLSAYRALIEDGKAEEPEATALRERLIKHYGKSDPVIQECDRLIRFQQFRLGKARPEGA